MLLRSERGGRRVLSRNADERSLTVECHKDEMLPAHWSDPSEWKAAAVCPRHSHDVPEQHRAASSAVNVHFEACYDSR